MRRFFGIRKEEAKSSGAAPTLSEAAAKLELQVKELEAKIAREDEEIRRLVERSSRDPTAKKRAMEVMKRKKMHEQSRDQLLGTQFNVEKLADDLDQVEITKTAVDAMRAAQEALTKQRISPEAVDGLMDQIADTRAEMQEINEILAQGVGTGVDQDELDAEFAQLQEEMAAEKLAGLSPASPAAVGTGASSTARPAAVEQGSLEEEFARLQAQMAPSAPPALAAPAASPA